MHSRYVFIRMKWDIHGQEITVMASLKQMVDNGYSYHFVRPQGQETYIYALYIIEGH